MAGGKKKTKTNKGRKNKGGNGKRAQKQNGIASSQKPNVSNVDNGSHLTGNGGATVNPAFTTGKSSDNEAIGKIQPKTLNTWSIIRRIHSDDNLENLEDYLSTHDRYDSASLAESMPRTAHDLYQGEVSSGEVAAELGYIRHMTLLGTRDNEVFDDAHKPLKEIICVNLAHEMTLEALPERFMKFGRRHSKVTSASLERFGQLREHFLHCLVKATRRIELEGSREDYLSKYKRVVMKLCEFWAPNFDQALFPKAGTFLRLCPLFNMTDKDLKEKLYKLLQNFLYECVVDEKHWIEDRLFDAVEGIARGFHLAEKPICWECGATSDSLTTCPECCVAKYCGTECQSDAWKSGHDKACCTLPFGDRLFQDALAKVNEAHSTGELGDFDLSPILDYYTVNQITLWLSQCLHEKRNPPPLSMESYYEALAKVGRGEWWLYREPIVINDSLKSDAKYWHVLRSLCIQGLLAAGETFPGDRLDALTAEDFLNFYKESIPSELSEKDRISIARQEKLRCVTTFRESFHKMPTKPTGSNLGEGDKPGEDDDVDDNAITAREKQAMRSD